MIELDERLAIRPGLPRGFTWSQFRRRLRVESRFMAAYVRANLRAGMEYRFAFWASVFTMIVNNLMWISFWLIFFARFPAIEGYDLRDVLTVWSIAAMGYGIAVGFFGNCMRFSPIIAEGRLDFYLVMPRPVFLHVLISFMQPSGWGDLIFGLGMYLVVVAPTLFELLGLLTVSLCAAAIIVAHASIANSLAFWLGRADGVARQMIDALIMFSTYPTTLFNGVVRVILFTAIPAGFIAYVPVRFLREWHLWQLGVMLGATAFYITLAIIIFQLGLRRYESGNLIAMRT